MRASALIAELQESISIHGDVDCAVLTYFDGTEEMTPIIRVQRLLAVEEDTGQRRNFLLLIYSNQGAVIRPKKAPDGAH